MERSEFLLGTVTTHSDETPLSPTTAPAAPTAPVPLPVLSPELVVGPAEDAAELDADRRADVALARLARSGDAPDHRVHGQDCDHLRRSPAPGGAPAVGYDGGPVPDDVAGRIERLRGSGEPLPTATRARMEQGFGASFAGVRLHLGEEPARLNRLVSAEAFTLGRDVFFGAGRFDPASPDGERVLAHELAHTLQPAAAVRRTPAALAVTTAVTNSGLADDDIEWLALHEAAVAYSKLAEDDYDVRAATLGDIDELARAWEKIIRVGSTEEVEVQRHAARATALDDLRGLVAVEHRELAAAGVTADEETQTVKALRFKGDYLLEQVMGGAAVLKVGDKGLYVTKIQQALADLDLLDEKEVSGTFGPSTSAPLKAYQEENGLAQSGQVDTDTLALLDKTFAHHGVELRIAQGSAAPERTTPGEYPADSAPESLTVGVRTLSDEDASAARDAIKTKQLGGPGGVLPTFVPDLGDGYIYGIRLYDILADEVEYEYQLYGDGKADKRHEGDLVGWPHIERVAARSKAATDAVFGKFTIGPALKQGAGIHDGWDQTVSDLSTEEKRIGAADWRVDKLLIGNSKVKALDREHGAIQSRPEEALIVDDVREKILDKYYWDLLEIHKGWPGFASDGVVNIQRFKSDEHKTNRAEMWDLFQTVVHEYLHTLEHSAHVAYRRGLDGQDGSMTLHEGVVEYFTYTVLESVKYDDALRRDVEGEFYEEGVADPIPEYRGYAEQAQAEKLAGIVGARNVMAAFFLGDVAKIGKAL